VNTEYHIVVLVLGVYDLFDLNISKFCIRKTYVETSDITCPNNMNDLKFAYKCLHYYCMCCVVSLCKCNWIFKSNASRFGCELSISST